MEINSINKILRNAAITMLGEVEELKSNVLAETARLVKEQKLSSKVIDGENGFYALCHITKENETIKEISFNEQCVIGRSNSLNPLDDALLFASGSSKPLSSDTYPIAK